MAAADIGLIGLGVMGSNLALNIAEKGFSVAVHNRTWERTEAFIAHAGELSGRVTACRTLADLSANIRPPRPIIILVKAGEPVDQQIAELRRVLDTGDIVIDAGNANFRDTVRRFQELDGSGIDFIGMGISGGEEGARHGPSIMAGGPEPSYARVESVLTKIAAQFKGDPCCALVGPGGAGHFVKTIHNGIEYADMQMIAEIYGLMRDGLGMAATDIAKVFETWNGGRLNSYLIEITAKVLAARDAKTGLPIVDVIEDRAGQKGTGKWAVIEAQMMGIAATTIEAAVAARILSSLKPERQRAAALYGIKHQPLKPRSRDAFLAQLEAALYAGKIAAYAQGFAVMEGASMEFDWGLPLGRIAAIWRAGCIIRSQFLDVITQVFESSGGSGHLLTAPFFVGEMKANQGALRATVADAAKSGTPAPALSAALAYFDSYTQARGTADLIQGQRDFFGAHGFERVNEAGEFHGDWSAT
jgi:6-phosphogluconate dehydrogenase